MKVEPLPANRHYPASSAAIPTNSGDNFRSFSYLSFPSCTSLHQHPVRQYPRQQSDFFIPTELYSQLDPPKVHPVCLELSKTALSQVINQGEDSGMEQGEHTPSCESMDGPSVKRLR